MAGSRAKRTIVLIDHRNLKKADFQEGPGSYGSRLQGIMEKLGKKGNPENGKPRTRERLQILFSQFRSEIINILRLFPFLIQNSKFRTQNCV